MQPDTTNCCLLIAADNGPKMLDLDTETADADGRAH